MSYQFTHDAEPADATIWKNVELVDLERATPPGTNYPGQGQPFGGLPTLDNAFTIYYGFDQYVQVFPGERRGSSPVKSPRGWGLFGRASISDGNPTPFEYFLSAGIGGDTRVGDDRGDTFGIGWFHNGVTNELGAIPAATLGRRQGWGIEMYYKLQLTPWLAVTPDVQLIRPGFGSFTNGDDAFVYGIRVNMNL